MFPTLLLSPCFTQVVKLISFWLWLGMFLVTGFQSAPLNWRGIISCVLLFCILLCGMMFLTRIRTMQAELAEKEMLIKILQHHASLSRSSSISSLLLPSSSSPLHSPHHRSPTNAAYMMSMSVPASGATSRQSSQVDDDQMYSCTSREQDQRPVHVKSSMSKSWYQGMHA